MSKPALVSIIIPTFNRAHLIGETLDSVLAQTYPNWECIVVDDGSTDGTKKLINAYATKDDRFQYYKRPDSYLPGGNGARNYGFLKSKGIYIQWFDDDDVMLPEFLNKKVLTFNQNLEMVICSGSYVKNDLSHIKNIDVSLHTSLFKDYVLWRAEILTPSVLFRKSFLEGKVLFLNKIYRGQETEFFSRMFFKLSIEKFKVLNTPLFLYRQHETTKSTINKGYFPKFKYSQSYIYIHNFKRSIDLKDKDLINHCFQTLLVYFFASIKNKDSKTTDYIYKELSEILKSNYFKVYIMFKSVGNVLIFLKRSSYLVEKQFQDIRL
ncbi:glycosyltransferase [Lacinutrix sp. WUR7]|uniref:glycosyltransferase family 2 protein n=1 Tax=Lacinutrix sp. WUR7 TaxID=2653681 RepID=UPI00193D169A|nr:glycosyltransferase family 2 protein [Lacinutrix sp. WUR7]QRM87797.1 glycosyltransferase [Lacinutrix sp. WUR7]